MLVGLPSARPSHQTTSSAVASSTLRSRTSIPGIIPAPSATRPAIFAVADDPDAAALTPTLGALRRLLRQSPAPLSRQEILAHWPDDEPPPRADSLWRCLTHGCELGILIRTGAGNKAEAFRYGVAEG